MDERCFLYGMYRSDNGLYVQLGTILSPFMRLLHYPGGQSKEAKNSSFTIAKKAVEYNVEHICEYKLHKI